MFTNVYIYDLPHKFLKMQVIMEPHSMSTYISYNQSLPTIQNQTELIFKPVQTQFKPIT